MTYAIPCFLIGMLVSWLICRSECKRLTRERDQFERESKALLGVYAAHLNECQRVEEDSVLEAEFVSGE